MTLKKNNIQCILLCLLFFSPLRFIFAAQFINNNLKEFSLSIQNQTTYFDYATKTYEVKTDQIGINWYEWLSKSFQGGLEYGYTDMTQINNPVASGKFSSGQFFGLLLRFMPIEQTYLSLAFNLNYRYNKTESKNNSLTSEFVWHESLFSSELELYPQDKISLLLAAEYLSLSGEQRNFGSTGQIMQFSTSKYLGYRIGLDFKPYPTAHIGLEWQAGYRDGFRVYFKRKF